MKDQLVSFEIATLARRKGFNEPCYCAYSSEEDDITDEDSSIFIQKCIDYTGEEFFTDEDIRAAIDNGYSRTCLAPTQSLLQRWLREKYKLMIGLTYYDVHGGFWEWRIHYKSRVGKADAYEQALEEGLKEALKLI